ncbi:MAG: hypothetical protein QM690_18650 [Sphingobium sp.]
MRLIAWLLTLAFGLAGLAFRVQGGIPHAFMAGTALLVLAGLSCPLLWRGDGGMLSFLGIRAKDRFMVALAMLVAVPLALPWPFWL